jgi:acetoacetyl-CoA synthetase
VLIATDGYVYGGKEFDRRAEVRKLVAALPSLRHVLHVPGLARAEEPLTPQSRPWSSLFARTPVGEQEFRYEDTPFDHPLWIVYSSGTTGLPKPFVHGHGGILLESLKFTHFHFNLQPGSCMFFYTTSGWVMWNILFSSLLTGASILLYDGNPAAPQPDLLWRLAQDAGVTMFGTSPAFLNQQMAAGIRPNRQYDLGRIDSMLVAGSPVMPEHMQWCYENVQPDLWLTSQSGGTDVATAFVGASPLLPVHAGEIQARCLGADVAAYDEQGHPVIDAVGELVVRQPMPSMPLYFWNDPGGRRYREAYFETYPGLWRHGDYLEINGRGGCRIAGRSDATLNRHGVRIGTAEIYRVVEALDEVQGSLIVHLDLPGGHSFMPLFVVLHEGLTLDESIEEAIRRALRELCSPRHVPDRILQIAALPMTLTGKKMEVPVRKILLGQDVEAVASRDAMADPAALDYFVDYARRQADYTC